MRVFHQKYVLTALALVLVSGCSVINPKSDEYKRASQLPPLEIPPQLSKPQSDDRNSIPDPKDVAASATYSEYAKSRGLPTLQNGYVPGGPVDPKTLKAHIERSGSDRWLVVNGSTEQVYAFIKDYLVESGLKISAEKPDIGVIETDWLEMHVKVDGGGLFGNLFANILDNLESASYRDRFTFRVDAGKTPGTAEVYVSHKGLEEVALGLDSFKWQPRPSDPQKEAEMLKSLMVKYGVDKDKAALEAGVEPKTTDKTQAAGKADLAKTAVIKGQLAERESGDSVIRVTDSFDRAWRQVSLAIDKSGLVVTDQNRQDGVFFVQYAPSKIKGDNPFDSDSGSSGIAGFFKSLWGSDDSKTKAPGANAVVKFPDNSNYRVLVLKREDTLTEVVVQDREGKKLTPEMAKRFLSILLAQQLS